MYETLLVLHLLAVTVMVATVVYFTALELGVPLVPGQFKVASLLVAISSGLALVFGVWLAFEVEAYDIWDPWILISILLWIVAGATGSRAGKTVEEQLEAGAPVVMGDVAMLQRIAAAATFAILVLMIFKPGA